MLLKISKSNYIRKIISPIIFLTMVIYIFYYTEYLQNGI